MVRLLQRLLLYQLSHLLIVPASFAAKSSFVIYPGEAYIQSVNYSGTGCPLGSANFTFHKNANEFNVSFKHFKLNNYTNYNTSYCELKFTIVAPPGVAYQLNSLTYQGYASLDQAGMVTIANASRLKGTTSINKSTQYVYGSLDNSTKQRFQQTALSNHYQTWSTCNKQRPLKITTTVNLNSKDQESTIAIDSINGKITFSRQYCDEKLNSEIKKQLITYK
ncbi:DUF4360 domain-containing protein [Spartinivicinus ruber]|uniref:DUF4360 domain-containing protein n=1 Tax=Spartinivicinus ruber TaxID=2683272 RepID=UPI0013D46926|nr:DUF4360 domain-containing protein [Spartinivicinus ruber]